MKTIKKFFKGLERSMEAVTFAEAGELETAGAIMREGDVQEEKSVVKKLDMKTPQGFKPTVASR